MAVTFPISKANALAEVRRIIREPVALNFTDTEINTWLQNGARQFSVLTLCNPVAEQLSYAAAGTLWLACTGKFFKIEHVIYDSTGVDTTAQGPIGLERISLEQIGNVAASTAGVPRFYAVWTANTGGVYAEFLPVIYFCPTITPGAGTPKIDVMGYQLLSDFPDAAQPTYAQYPCIYFALSCCAAKAGQHTLSALYIKKFLADSSYYRNEIADWRKQVDSKDKFKLPDITRTAPTG